jgi:hypothetical protein
MQDPQLLILEFLRYYYGAAANQIEGYINAIEAVRTFASDNLSQWSQHHLGSSRADFSQVCVRTESVSANICVHVSGSEGDECDGANGPTRE